MLVIVLFVIVAVPSTVLLQVANPIPSEILLSNPIGQVGVAQLPQSEVATEVQKVPDNTVCPPFTSVTVTL